ncbi:uracil-DNA glycosylase [Pseudoduganella danionis]|uniref:uracil-DNA glycosylase n=1 Tax=Pseudoduganella danionis TaxID=1890295 RepID=UPI0035B05F93
MDKRSAIFLDEMGIGVQWQLRQRPAAPAAGELPAEAEPLADAAQDDIAPPTMEAAELPVPEHLAATAAAPAAATAAVNTAAPTEAVTMAPASASPSAPVAAPVPVSVPASASGKTAGAEDMSWFDDVPAPMVAPTLKGKPAAAAATSAAPLSDAAIAVLDWPALQSAISHCTRCTLCQSRQQPTIGRGSQTAGTVAVVAAASAQDEAAAELVSGDAGQLLGNMLSAIELDLAGDVYLTALVKCRPVDEQGQARAPSASELQACRPYLERELALTGATLAITFGQHAARGLMLGAAARGSVMAYGASGLPVVATYHPDDLLQRPQDKAKAWADLCLARSVRD